MIGHRGSGLAGPRARSWARKRPAWPSGSGIMTATSLSPQAGGRSGPRARAMMMNFSLGWQSESPAVYCGHGRRRARPASESPSRPGQPAYGRPACRWAGPLVSPAVCRRAESDRLGCRGRTDGSRLRARVRVLWQPLGRRDAAARDRLRRDESHGSGLNSALGPAPTGRSAAATGRPADAGRARSRADGISQAAVAAAPWHGPGAAGPESAPSSGVFIHPAAPRRAAEQRAPRRLLPRRFLVADRLPPPGSGNLF